MTSDDPAIAAVIGWLTEHGGAVRGMAIEVRDGRRGAFATEALDAETELVRVPRSLLITREVMRASSVARQLRDAGVELSSPHALYAAWLAVEARRPVSDHAPYLATLPDDIDGFPLTATDAELRLLHGTTVGQRVHNQRQAVASDYQLLARKIRLMADVSEATYAWARICVGSRVFAVTIDDLDTTTLVPLADMLNHDRTPSVRWQYDQAVEAFTLVTTGPVAAGAELYLHYGTKSNGLLLTQYGFYLDDNQADEAEVRGHWVTADPTDEAAKELWAALRAEQPTEAFARVLLDGAVVAGVSMLPATPAEDAALLAGTSLTPLGRRFVAVRSGEHRVLAAWAALAVAPAFATYFAAAATAPERSDAIVAA